MTVLQTILLYGFLVLALLFIADGLISFFFNVVLGKEKRINQRLKLQEQGKKPDEILQLLKSGDKSDYSFKRLLPFYSVLYRLIFETNSQISVERFYGIVGISALAWVLLLQILFPVIPLWGAVLLAVILGAAPILLFLINVRATKRKKFEAQLPDALDLIVRSLRIGHPLSASVEVVASEMPDPLGSEFGLVFDEISYGKEVPEAVQEMAERVPVADLKYFAVAVQIHYESGGNLAEILDGLSKVIRDRFRMFRKVRALTTEGRISAWFLSCFPVALIAIIQLVKPDYYSQVYDYPFFREIVIVVFALLIVNIFAMRMITSIKV